MAEVGYASLGIIPSFDGFQSKLESGTAPGLLAAGRSGGSKFGGVAGSTAGKRFGSVFSSAAKASLVGLAGAGALAVAFGKSAIDEARDARKVGALTASTIKATGKAANVSARQVANLAEKISDKTGIDDEQIQAGQNMLLTFKNIRNEAGKGGKIFDQTSRVLVDLSSAMGTDAKSSAIQLGKALNDPVKGITALTRVGVTFSDQQKKQIEQMVEAGDVAGAQTLILSELKSEFGGAAAAQADEADKLSTAWGNFKEEIGTELLPVLDDVAIFLRKKGIPAVRDFSDWATDKGVPAVKDFYDEAKPLADKVLPAIGSAFETTKDAAKKIAPLLEGVFDGFNKLPDWVQSVIVLGAGAAALKSKLGGGKSGLAGGLLGGISQLKPIPVFVTNPGGLGGSVGGGVGGGGKGSALKFGLGAAITASPYLLPLLTSGSQAPGQEPDYDTAHKGYIRLLQLTGAEDGEALHDALLSATQEQLAGYRKVLRDELGIGFKAIGQIQFDSGVPALPDGLTVGDLRKADKAWGDFYATASAGFKSLPKKVQVLLTTEGGPETMQDLRDLKRQFDLTPKEVKTLVKVYGVDEAKRQVEVALTPFMVGRTPAKESQGSDAMLPAPSDVPSRGRTSGRRGSHVTINQNINTVNDSKQLNKDAAAKAQQAAMGGW